MNGGKRPAYGWRDYARDKLPYAAAFLLSLLLAAAVIGLDLRQSNGRLHGASLWYVAVLAVFVLGAWLLFDGWRSRSYYRQLNAAAERFGQLDAPLVLRSAATREQQAFGRLLHDLHEACRNELEARGRQAEIHHHFTMQWVHQMKTPISVIDLLVQQSSMDAGEDGPPDKSRDRSILEETDRLRRGLDMMLHTARLDKFEVDLHVRKAALHVLARDVLNDYKRLCIHHSVFPRIEGEAEAETDPKWLIFVLRQLVTNAIKYSKPVPGSKKLLIRIAAAGDDGCTLSVRDEGIGIPAHDLPRVFDPFFTGENGRRTEESTGMGLYLAKRICAGLGHGLHVESIPGEGTTVTVAFRASGIHRM